MPHVDAITDALASNDVRTVEAAFLALILFPHGEAIVGAGSVDALCRLLTRVTRALQHDESLMPSGTANVIATALNEPVSTTATFATGARIVADHHYHWRGVYLQHAANTGGV